MPEVSVGPAGPHWSIVGLPRRPRESDEVVCFSWTSWSSLVHRNWRYGSSRLARKFQLDQLVLIGPSPLITIDQSEIEEFQLDQLVLIGPSTIALIWRTIKGLRFSWTSWSSLVHPV